MKKILCSIIILLGVISCGKETRMEVKPPSATTEIEEGFTLQLSDTQTVAQSTTKQSVIKRNEENTVHIEEHHEARSSAKPSAIKKNVSIPKSTVKINKPKNPIHIGNGTKPITVKPVKPVQTDNTPTTDTAQIHGNTPPAHTEHNTNKPTIKVNKQLRFAFKVPDSMEIQGSYEVLFRLTKVDDTVFTLVAKSEKQQFIFDSAEVVLPSVKKIKMTLTDPTNKNFEIRNNNNGHDIQYLPENTYAEWIWYVTPLKAGKNRLVFIGSFIDDSHTNEKANNRKFYEKPIVVITTNEYYVGSVVDFFSENWQWFADNLFAAFGGVGGLIATVWIVIKKLNKKKTDTPDTTNQPVPPQNDGD